MKKLSIAYTPDSDDVFNFYAWEHRHVTLGGDGGFEPVFSKGHIIELNRAALVERSLRKYPSRW